MTTPVLSIIQQWHAALNAAEPDQLVTLLHPEVEIGGPRGVTRGAEVVREWFDRANVRMLPQRWFARANRVVVEQMGEWLSEDRSEVVGSQMVASAFSLNDRGQITRIVRHDTLEAALKDVALSQEDQIELDERSL